MPIEQLRSQQRHVRILEAAERAFARRGYHHTSVDDVAAEADTSKGGIYFHFPTKQAIFLALLDRVATTLRSRVEEAVARQAQPLARAEAALRVVLDTFADNPHLARLYLVESLGAGPEFNARMAQIRLAFAELIRQQLEEAVASGAIAPIDTTTAAAAWFGALHEVVIHWALAEAPGRLEDAYPTIRLMLLRGIGVSVPASASVEDAGVEVARL
jgi:AcrR family transcriptional regulator